MRIRRRLKAALRSTLQRTLGLDLYLLLFAVFRLVAFRIDPRDAVLRHFLALVPRDAAALDLGANVGWTTALLARRAHAVHAFEPIPANHRALCRLRRLLGLRNVTIYRMALGSHDGPVEMVTPVSAGGTLHGLSHMISSDRRTEAGWRFTVECRRLDNLASVFASERIGAVKIDVEEAESSVIDGARQLLRQHRPIVLCELWRTSNRSRAMTILAELGYEAHAFEAGGLVPFDPSRHEYHLDFVFLPGPPTV
jgi:FkbM family methyltransferase